MEDIFFYTPSFEEIHIEPKVTSLQWHTKYADVGTMELHTSTKNEIVEKLIPYRDKDVIVKQGKNSAWVSGMSDMDGNFDFGIYGKTLNYMLEWRVVDPFIATGIELETLIRNKIREKFIDEGKNKIPNFVLGELIGSTGQINYEVVDKQISLLTLIQNLCAIENLGFRIDFDTDEKEFVFNLYRGLDRRKEQTERNALIFSEDEKTIRDLKYTFMSQDYYSMTYLRVENEETQTVSFNEVLKDDLTGFKRRELLSNTIDKDECISALKQATKTEILEGQVRNIKYGVDYNLGDLATTQDRIGNEIILQDKRVVEVIQIFEPLNSYEKPILKEVIDNGI